MEGAPALHVSVTGTIFLQPVDRKAKPADATTRPTDFRILECIYSFSSIETCQRWSRLFTATPAAENHDREAMKLHDAEGTADPQRCTVAHFTRSQPFSNGAYCSAVEQNTRQGCHTADQFNTGAGTHRCTIGY
jgi:hypothetical protein